MYKTYTENLDSPGGYLSKLLVMMVSAFSGISAADKRKWLMRANLTAFLIVLSLLQVSASSLAQKVTLKENNVSLEKVFREIRKQTGYDVLVDNTDFKTSKKINVNFVDAPLEKVMDLVVSGTGLTYVFEDKTVVIKEKPIVDKVKVYFANIDVTGRVVDEKGEPVAGATIKVKGTSIVASSNGDGVFVLRNVGEDAVLEISYLGYQAREVKVAKDLGSIRMEVLVGKLEEVQINAGYYTVSDRERTGSISRVSSKDIEKQPVSNVLMALQGRVPGMVVTQQTGVPGGGFAVQIRGRSSINSLVGNDPLYLVDNVVYPSAAISGRTTGAIFGSLGSSNGVSPLSNINPLDIESIEILKDADATAIYGSRGANGVVLITTKKGKAGSTKVNSAVTHGYSEIGHKVDLLNTEEYLAMRLEALKNDNLLVTTTDYDINGKWDSKRYTDWQQKFIGGQGKVTNASVNVTGGGEKGNYLLAGNYYDENTVFPGDLGLTRVNLRSSINIGSTEDRFQATFSGNFSHTKQNLPVTDLTQYIFLAPNAPDLYNEYGKLNYLNNTLSVNPYSFLLQSNKADMNNVLGNVNLSYRFLKNLIFKTSLGYSYIIRNEATKTPLESFNPFYNFTALNRVSRFSDNYNTSFLVEPQFTYDAKVGSGKINALVGMSMQDSRYQFRTIKASNYSSDELMDNIAAASTITNDLTEFAQYKYIAAFARLNYIYREKYLLNFTARRDGSSRFGSDKQFSNFGAIGAAWIFSDELFLKGLKPFLSFGKLRTSYGITGNDQIGNYGYLQLWTSTATYQGTATVSPVRRAPNPDFSWETNRKFEIAMQLGFLKDHIIFEVSYYKNKSSNQLLDNLLSPSTGLVSVFANSPGVVQNTGLEVQGNFKIINAENWEWSSSVNFTLPKNKLIAYPGLASSPKALDYEIGKPLSILKVSKVSVDQQTGLYVIEDKNANGLTQYDDGDRYLIKFLGQRYYGGLQNSIRFKNFNLDFTFSAVKQNGRDYRNLGQMAAGTWSTNQNTNQFSEILRRWQNSGDQVSVQRFGTNSDVSTADDASKYNGSLSIVDASFIRLRNLSLSYSVPKNWLNFAKLSNATINLQGQNLFTITNYIGLDPEIQSSNNLPSLRTLTLGLNITF